MLLVRVYRADGRCWCENGWCVSLPAASSICHSSEERPHLPSVCFHLSQFPRSSSSFKRSQSILQQIVQNGQKWWLAMSPKIIDSNLSRDNLFCNSNFFDTWSLSITSHQKLDIERMGNCTQPVQLGHWYYGKKVWWCLFLKPQVDVTSSCCEVVKFWRGRVDTQVRVDISHDWVRWTMTMKIRWGKVDNEDGDEVKKGGQCFMERRVRWIFRWT